MKSFNTLIFSISFFLIAYANGQSIVVNSTNYKQTIDMIGGDIERNSIAIQNAENKDEIIEWGFKDINFNYCRVQFDKNQELIEGIKNWEFYTKQVITMQQIKAVNPNIHFFATMRTDYDGFGDDNNMPDWIVNYETKKIEIDKYAIFLADYLEFMENQGVSIHTISITKEWASFVNARRSDNITTSLREQCEERDITMPLVSEQGFWSISQGISFLEDVEERGSQDQYVSFCSHNYANEGFEKWVEIAEKSAALGKPIYDDESSTGSGSPTYGVERAMFKQIDEYKEKAERYEAGLSGEIYFEIWSRGIDKETRAIYFPSGGRGTRLRGYYMMKYFSNNVLGHTYLSSSIDGISNMYTITFRKDDKIVLWVINEGTSDYNIPITMDNSIITSNIDVQYWTNNVSVEGATTTYNASGNSFIVGVEAESMNCYIFNVSEDVVDICDIVSREGLIEAECYDNMLGVETQENNEGSSSVAKIGNDGWFMFEDVDFGNGVDKINTRFSSNGDGGIIELRTDSLSGELIGTLNIENTSDLNDLVTVNHVINRTEGVKDVYFIFKGNNETLINLNWFELKKIEPSIDLNVLSSEGSVALSWNVENLEVVTQNIYRNTVFTETGKILIAEDVNGTNYIDDNVVNEVTYYYWIEVIDLESNISNSDIVSVTPSIPNLALSSNGSIASQSSTDYGGTADRAIDGNIDGTFGNESVTHTEHNVNGTNTLKWWQVEMPKTYSINTIVIHNRTGSNYGERLNNIIIEVLNENGDIVFTNFIEDYPNPSTTIDVGGIDGKIVKISKTSDYGITLAEVQVYGSEPLLSSNILNNEVNIYMNSMDNILSIDNCLGAFVSIYDIYGKELFHDDVTNDNYSYNLRSLNSGVYIVKLVYDRYVLNKKIIKK